MKNKFLIAHNISTKIHKIRKLYNTHLNCNRLKYFALATFFIDKLCMRCGTLNETGTYGCTTLLKKHIKVIGNKITFNFIGKDSIPFNKSIALSKSQLQCLNELLLHKKNNDRIFSNNVSVNLNEYLNKIEPNLTAKTFRTLNASKTFHDELNKTIGNPMETYVKANTVVAQLCNHTGLQTSKSNYIDPRIIVSYCKKNRLDINKCLSKQLIAKYNWALDTPKSFAYQ